MGRGQRLHYSTCLAQGHLEHILRWEKEISHFSLPQPRFPPSLSLWLDHTTPRSQSGEWSAPISYCCSDSDEIAISLSVAACKIGICVSRGWTLGTCVSVQTADPPEKVGPVTAVPRLGGCCAITHKEREREGRFPHSCREHHWQTGRLTESPLANVYCMSMWTLICVTDRRL